MAIVLPNGKQQFFASDGSFGNGFKLYTYVAGTSTPKDTYTDYTGGTANDNPVIANTRGEMTVYWDGVYDVILKDASDVTIWGPERLDGEPRSTVADLANTSDTSLGDALIGVKRSGGVATTLHDMLETREYYAADFGVTADGSTDDTSALNTAISVAGENSRIVLPPGTIKVTSTITISNDRVHLVGAGIRATTILFAPSANDTCIEIADGVNSVWQGSLRDFSISSDDPTYTKTAIILQDVRSYHISNIEIKGGVVHGGTYFWSGANSIGIHIKGRDFTQFNNVSSFADRPLLIDVNPNEDIDIDHFSFRDFYPGAYQNPCVEIAQDVRLTQVTFDGAQPWVLGTYGLYWNSTTGEAVVSNGLNLHNVRTEQGSDANAWMFYIDHHQTLQDLHILHVQGGSDRKGIYLRNCDSVTLNNFRYTNASLVALDVDSSVNRIVASNCFWQAGSTANIAGQRLVWSGPKNPATGPLPPDFVYSEATDQTDTNYRTTFTECANGGYTVELADDAEVILGPQTMGGVLFVVRSDYRSAQFSLHGTNGACYLIADTDPVTGFDDADTDGLACVYWNAGDSTYRLKNRLGSTLKFRVIFNGTYEYFGP